MVPQINEMTKEVENGRLMRIMVKLNAVNESDSDGIRVCRSFAFATAN